MERRRAQVAVQMAVHHVDAAPGEQIRKGGRPYRMTAGAPNSAREREQISKAEEELPGSFNHAHSAQRARTGRRRSGACDYAFESRVKRVSGESRHSQSE